MKPLSVDRAITLPFEIGKSHSNKAININIKKSEASVRELQSDIPIKLGGNSGSNPGGAIFIL